MTKFYMLPVEMSIQPWLQVNCSFILFHKYIKICHCYCMIFKKGFICINSVRFERTHVISKHALLNLILVESGRIFTFGPNDWGQLGLGHVRSQNKPSCIKCKYM